MDMEPTLFIISLIVVANLKHSLQDSLENFNEMIDQLIADTERKAAPTSERDTDITSEKINNAGPTTESFKSSTEKISDLVSSTEKDIPTIINLNDVKPNNSRIIYLNKFLPRNQVFEDDDNTLQILPSKQSHLDDNEILTYFNSKPSLDNNNNKKVNRTVPKYPKTTKIDNVKRPTLLNSGGSIESNNDLPFFLNSRRNIDGNSSLSPFIENPKDFGSGIILKEEIVFEIEDDKPSESSKPPIKILIHTTTPKPVVVLLKQVTGKNMNTTYSVLEGNTDESIYFGPFRTQHNKSFGDANHEKVPKLLSTSQISRSSDNNFRIHAEFKKLNEKINTLQEFLNKTFDKKNETVKNLKLYQQKSTDKSDLRIGHPDYESNEKGTSVDRIMNFGAKPHIFHSRQGIVEKVVPGVETISRSLLLNRGPLIAQPVQQHSLLLQLAEIAKINQDVHLINRLRTRSKYIVPIVPVYRHRVVY